MKLTLGHCDLSLKDRSATELLKLDKDNLPCKLLFVDSEYVGTRHELSRIWVSHATSADHTQRVVIFSNHTYGSESADSHGMKLDADRWPLTTADHRWPPRQYRLLRDTSDLFSETIWSTWPIKPFVFMFASVSVCFAIILTAPRSV